MRIGVDLRPCFKKSSRRRGIGKVAYQQIRRLLEIPQAHDYVLFAASADQIRLPGRYSVQTAPCLKRPERLTWLLDRAVLKSRVDSSRLDIFHASEITSIPRTSSCRVWATVYDLIPLIFREQTKRTVPWDFRLALKAGYRRVGMADRIVTCSEHSKKDICERLDVPASKVETVYLACDESFGPRDPEESKRRLREHRSIAGPFLFYVGGGDFRKNLPLLVRAFARIRNLGYEGKLVLAGETFLWKIAETELLRREIARLGLEEKVEFPGYVEDEDLPFFYSACDFFVFPSLYEGFGLPVLEALQCGAPVLASRAASIPEVAGEAALYFDPEDIDSLVSQFERVHLDRKRLDALRQDGFQQAARFSWDETARRLHQLYAAG